MCVACWISYYNTSTSCYEHCCWVTTAGKNKWRVTRSLPVACTQSSPMKLFHLSVLHKLYRGCTSHRFAFSCSVSSVDARTAVQVALRMSHLFTTVIMETDRWVCKSADVFIRGVTASVICVCILEQVCGEVFYSWHIVNIRRKGFMHSNAPTSSWKFLTR